MRMSTSGDSENFYGSALKKLREKALLSPAELAKKAQCQELDIETIENGHQLPSFLLLSQICKGLGITMRDIFFRE